MPRRARPARPPDPVKAAARALLDHTKHCFTCHAAHSHPALYCDTGWGLASEVSKQRAMVRARTQIRARSQGGLW